MTRKFSELVAEGKEAKERYEQYEKALAWCKNEEKGARSCLSAHPEWTLMTRSGLQDRLEGKIINGEESAHKYVLTFLEERELVQWLNACAKQRSGKYREEIAAKVLDILKARRKQNKKGGVKHVPFSKSAGKVLVGGELSKDWFHGFFSRHDGEIKWAVPGNMDMKRAASNTEEAVEAHFEGQFGLRAELIDAGIMDAETGCQL